MVFDQRALKTREAFWSGSVFGPLLDRLAQLRQENMPTLNINLDADLAGAFNALGVKPSEITPELLLLTQILRNQTGLKQEPSIAGAPEVPLMVGTKVDAAQAPE